MKLIRKVTKDFPYFVIYNYKNIIDMKTWYSKEEQRWVSEIPKAFWLGIYDRIGNKIYSDTKGYNDPYKGLNYNFPLNNAKVFFEKYGYYPAFRVKKY